MGSCDGKASLHYVQGQCHRPVMLPDVVHGLKLLLAGRKQLFQQLFTENLDWSCAVMQPLGKTFTNLYSKLCEIKL